MFYDLFPYRNDNDDTRYLIACSECGNFSNFSFNDPIHTSYPEVIIVGSKINNSNGELQGSGWSERSGLDNANIIVGATSVVPSTIEMGTVLIKQSANYTDDIAKVARISSKTGKALGYVGVGLTIADGITNGWKNHHTADVIIGGAQTLLLGAGPVGWGIGLVWLTADLITTGLTDKSITENLFD